jgi:hypothetical protein
MLSVITDKIISKKREIKELVIKKANEDKDPMVNNLQLKLSEQKKIELILSELNSDLSRKVFSKIDVISRLYLKYKNNELDPLIVRKFENNLIKTKNYIDSLIKFNLEKLSELVTIETKQANELLKFAYYLSNVFDKLLIPVKNRQIKQIQKNTQSNAKIILTSFKKNNSAYQKIKRRLDKNNYKSLNMYFSDIKQAKSYVEELENTKLSCFYKIKHCEKIKDFEKDNELVFLKNNMLEYLKEKYKENIPLDDFKSVYLILYTKTIRSLN